MKRIGNVLEVLDTVNDRFFALTEAQVLAAELEKVQSKVPTLFERDCTFFADIEKRPVEVVSKRDMRVPLEIRPGGRFGHFDTDGGSLGRGDAQQYEKALVPTVDLKIGIEWTKKAEWATDDTRKSVVNTLKAVMAKSMPEFRRNVDALCMTGGDGVLATVSAVANAGGKDTYTLAAAGDGFGAKLLRYGQYLSLYSANLGVRRPFAGLAALAGEAPIDLYDLANKQVRMNSQAAGAIATDKLVVSGLTATPPVSLLGVPYHHNDASTGNWLALDRALFPEIRANRVNAASAGLALPFARLAVNKVMDRVGLDNGTRLSAYMHVAQVQAYEEMGQVVSIIQKQAREEALNMYFNDGMQLAGAPIRKSMLWDKTRIDFINKEIWGRAEMHPAGFYTVNGNKLFPIYGSDGGVATATIFYITCSFNLFINNPAAAVYISNLTVPSGY